MKRIQNKALQIFVEKFVNDLKRENEDRENHGIKELNIPFILSTLYQSFAKNDNKYEDFASDLEQYSDYNILISESANDYNGIIDVDIPLLKYLEEDNCGFCDYDEPDYDYQLRFSYDERDWGYCECTPDMPDYREDKHCCGHGCDASFCSFSLHKILHVANDTWSGDEHDYWEFEDAFYATDKKMADEKQEQERKRKIKELKARIEEDQKALAKLEEEK